MSGHRRRIDVELVRRKLVSSREEARQMIAQNRVTVAGVPVTKPARQVLPDSTIKVAAPSRKYASRGAHKLLGALDHFGSLGLRGIEGRFCLDAGASTGGFTDVLLQRGAEHVIAVDVGYGQMVWSLSSDARVTVLDRTNVRLLDPKQLPFRPDLIVADLSFISLTKVLPALASCADPRADLLLMVKPQFEVGKSLVGPKGVVRDPALRAKAVADVSRCAQELGLGTTAVVASSLPGPSGNVEYFVWLQSGHDGAIESATEAAIEAAIEEGPQ